MIQQSVGKTLTIIALVPAVSAQEGADILLRVKIAISNAVF